MGDDAVGGISSRLKLSNLVVDVPALEGQKGRPRLAALGGRWVGCCNALMIRKLVVHIYGIRPVAFLFKVISRLGRR